MEKTEQYLALLEKRGVRLNQQEGKIKYNAPKGELTSEDINFLKSNKQEIIEILKKRSSYLSIKVNPEGQYEPFPLTSIQEAYFLGRNNTYRYGGVSCHIYLEIEYPSLDFNKVQEVWNKLINRHGMLKTVFYQNGYQQELSEVPEFKMLRATDEDGRIEIRNELSNKMCTVDQWPLFDIGVSNTINNSVLHFSTEFLIVDWTSIWKLLSEFEGIYFRKEEKSKLKLRFRDYVLAERQLKNDPKYEKDKAYWLEKIPTLYESPKIPLSHTKQVENSFRRMQLEISPSQWDQIKARCKQSGITPTSFILTLYAKVLARYSESSDFCINMIMLNRLPLHEEVNDIIGDFTSNTLIPISLNYEEAFCEQIRQINQTLFESLDHKLFSGIEILRELSRLKGRDAAFMPIIFTSAIGISGKNDVMVGKILNTGISQTPQAFIDCQVMDGTFGLRINWDVREGIFYDGYLEDMFNTFKDSVLEAATLKVDWDNVYSISLLNWQKIERSHINDTNKQMINKTLHELIFEQAQKTPNLLAVADSEQEICYREVIEKSMVLAAKIKAMGGTKGEHIGIIMPKNRHQVVAVLGILFAGGVYVPIEDSEAVERVDKILDNTHIKLLLTHSKTKYTSESVKVLRVDKLNQIESDRIEFEKDANLPAYIIHTSGSTGMPKGVVINHKSAVNTICDINERFNINEGDRVLGLSQLNFDLSVYDIFGLLSVGGAVIYPDSKKNLDPSHWAALIQKYNVTVWNTVPSIMVMLQEYMKIKSEQKLDSMKVVFLSGDWIPIHLPQNISKFLTNARIVSLGGATEASIWSIYHEYKGLNSEWVSIPYGKPLANQQIHILNNQLEDNPVWLKGDLYISGAGLALEYFGNEKVTNEQFFYAPTLGKRVYRTGDIGRYMPDGEIEFLGREDKQVKVLGYRIELGEIEAALKQYPRIEGCVVMTMPIGNVIKIIAVIWGEASETEENEMKEFLKTKLPSYMIPYKIVKLQEVSLTSNGKIDRETIQNKIRIKMEAISQKPDQGSQTTVSPHTQQIKDSICNIMELEDIDLSEEFYSLGADSLVMNRIAVCLEEMFSQYCNFEEVLIQLLNYPTIEAFSKFIEEKILEM